MHKEQHMYRWTVQFDFMKSRSECWEKVIASWNSAKNSAKNKTSGRVWGMQLMMVRNQWWCGVMWLNVQSSFPAYPDAFYSSYTTAICPKTFPVLIKDQHTLKLVFTSHIIKCVWTIWEFNSEIKTPTHRQTTGMISVSLNKYLFCDPSSLISSSLYTWFISLCYCSIPVYEYGWIDIVYSSVIITKLHFFCQAKTRLQCLLLNKWAGHISKCGSLGCGYYMTNLMQNIENSIWRT